MDIENFWKIINKTNVLGIQGTVEDIDEAILELEKYDEKDIILFEHIYCVYVHLLQEKYKWNEFDWFSDEQSEELQGILSFIIALGYRTYKYFYNLRLNNIRKVNEYLDTLYNKMMFNGEEHNGMFYGFCGLEDIAECAYINKLKKQYIPSSIELDEKVIAHIYKSLEN